MTDEPGKKNSSDCYFSVSIDLILVDTPLPYDLFINSSKNANREKFVRIHAKEREVSPEELENFKQKYFQIYIPEEQRSVFLKSMVKSEEVTDEEKTKVIKDSAIHYLSNIFDDTKEFNTEILSETIEGCRDSVESMVEVIQDKDVGGIQSMIASLSFHDFYTYDHSINVSMYSISILKALKPDASKEELTAAGLGGMLHDLGKINIPTHIINNPGKLSEEEFAVIKSHPETGGELIDQMMESNAIEGVDLPIVKRVVCEHHENYNGTGYPMQKDEKDIHLLARITAIADFFDALTTKRSYHEALSIEDAISVMEKASGKKIDPKIFTAFKKNAVNIVQQPKLNNQELPEDYDPCQPQNVLPLRKVPPKSLVNDFFGKKDDKKKKAS